MCILVLFLFEERKISGCWVVVRRPPDIFYISLWQPGPCHCYHSLFPRVTPFDHGSRPSLPSNFFTISATWLLLSSRWKSQFPVPFPFVPRLARRFRSLRGTVISKNAHIQTTEDRDGKGNLQGHIELSYIKPSK